mmetsp:Transcript_2240/g.4151  ORF Transcript_2240/g.4151 Transcript_2240/m.4151 type:complete len:147 (-) Transcript_2240:293-733(-)
MQSEATAFSNGGTSNPNPSPAEKKPEEAPVEVSFSEQEKSEPNEDDDLTCNACGMMRQLFESPCGESVKAFVRCYQKLKPDEDIGVCMPQWKIMDQCKQEHPEIFKGIFPEPYEEDDPTDAPSPSTSSHSQADQSNKDQDLRSETA